MTENGGRGEEYSGAGYARIEISAIGIELFNQPDFPGSR
jgi:hypothetical protein